VTRNRVLVVLVALGALVASIAFGDTLSLAGLRALIAREFPDVPFITAEALERALRGEVATRPRLVDARTEAEFAVSHLQHAVRVDPDHPNLTALGDDKARPVVVYCSVGYRSAAIGRALMRAGFTRVTNLEEGIFGWANRGLPVYRDGRVVHDVHPYDDTWGRLLREDLRTRVPR
jgi:rhodanese-related sulfurtransferase